MLFTSTRARLALVSLALGWLMLEGVAVYVIRYRILVGASFPGDGLNGGECVVSCRPM